MSLAAPSLHRPLKIVLASPEAVPFAKTGGLADVAGALPLELAALGHDVRLIIPRYGFINGQEFGFVERMRLSVPTAAGPFEATVEEGVLSSPRRNGRSVPVWAVRYDPYFDRPGLYQEAGADYPDNLERFAFFCRAIMELLVALHRSSDWMPDLLHLHDWQTALCPVYLRTLYRDYAEATALKTLLTIHNLGYQGLFPAAAYSKTGLSPALFSPAALEFFGSVNVLKGGLIYADYLNTVSPTYSREIQTAEFGFGLEGVLKERRHRLVGIVNGIDCGVWNPQTDPYTAAHYSVEHLDGKRECKKALQRELKLPARKMPMIGVVSRLSDQKGLDLIIEIMPELMALNLQFVVLGTGDPAMEEAFRTLQGRYPKQVGLRIGFDDPLAHRIEAGADLFLMPSRYEPCGLSQLYSLRYGTVPVVRRTGGLADTVVNYSPLAVKAERATGFLFGEARPDDLLAGVLLALRIYADKAEWRTLMLAGMRSDVSWERSAKAYEELYREVLRWTPEDSSSAQATSEGKT